MYIYLYESIKMHMYMYAYLNILVCKAVLYSCISIHLSQRKSEKNPTGPYLRVMLSS